MTLDQDPLIQDIRARIKKEIDHYTESIANGGAASFDDYKRLVGIRKGLGISLNKIEDSIKLYIDDDA